MEEFNEHQQAKQLWKQYQSEIGSPSTCPDALQLASFVDGQCPEHETEEMEQHMALCSTCLETITLLRDPSLGSPEPPAYVVEQAKGLVVEPAVGSRPHQETVHWWTRDWGRLQWAAMAATCAGICVIGFNLGMTVQQTQMQIDQIVVSEMIFGLGDHRGGLGVEWKPEM